MDRPNTQRATLLDWLIAVILAVALAFIIIAIARALGAPIDGPVGLHCFARTVTVAILAPGGPQSASRALSGQAIGFILVSTMPPGLE